MYLAAFCRVAERAYAKPWMDGQRLNRFFCWVENFLRSWICGCFDVYISSVNLSSLESISKGNCNFYKLASLQRVNV